VIKKFIKILAGFTKCT